MQIRFKKLRDNAVLPRFGTDGAAAADLTACLTEPVVLEPGGHVSIPTGLAVELPGQRSWRQARHHTVQHGRRH